MMHSSVVIFVATVRVFWSMDTSNNRHQTRESQRDCDMGPATQLFFVVGHAK